MKRIEQDIINQSRIGETNINRDGEPMRIIAYYAWDNVKVEFYGDYPCEVTTRYTHFQNGILWNPMRPDVYGWGYFGIGEYSKAKHPYLYKAWRGMIERCKSISFQERNPTYKDCSIDDRFKCFQDFCKWITSQPNYVAYITKYKELKFSIDKDILIKGNKIYSPDTCLLVPAQVNNLTVVSKATRGDLPLGVYKCNKNKYRPYMAIVCSKCYGYYATIEEAFERYKEVKKQYMIDIATKHFELGNITLQCKEAIENYPIEITD